MCVCSFELRGRLFLSTFLLGSICTEIGGVLLLILPSGLNAKTSNGIINPIIVHIKITKNHTHGIVPFYSFSVFITTQTCHKLCMFRPLTCKPACQLSVVIPLPLLGNLVTKSLNITSMLIRKIAL